jgi:type IV pilus assembly protein PilW
MMNCPSLNVRGQSGISIIELMITLTLGLFIVGGIMYVFSSSRTVFSSNDAGARIQEDGRMAMERLTRVVRQAGFMGCSNSQSVIPLIIADSDADGNSAEHATFVPGDGIQVFDNGTGWTNPTTITRIAGTDVIQIKGLSTCTAKLTANMAADDADIEIGANSCGWSGYQVLVIADCTNIDIFAASAFAGGSISHADTRNTDSKLGKAYGKDSLVFGYAEKTFFIGMHPTLNLPVLYEMDFDGNAVTVNEVAANIYDLQVLSVQVDSIGGDSVPDETKALPVSLPDTVNWSQVLSLRARFSVRSESDNTGPSSLTYTFNGVSVTDKRVKRDFATVIGIRNRLP